MSACIIAVLDLPAGPCASRAASEIEESTGNLALRSAELIAATLTGSQATAVRQGRATAASLQQVEAAQNLWSVHGVINDANSGNIASAASGSYVQSLNSWVSSALTVSDPPLCLHAWRIKFWHPGQKQVVTCTAKPPVWAGAHASAGECSEP